MADVLLEGEGAGGRWLRKRYYREWKEDVAAGELLLTGDAVDEVLLEWEGAGGGDVREWGYRGWWSMLRPSVCCW